MTNVWFIRHGESVSNADLPTTHPAESALTAKGVVEADAVAKRFVERPQLIVTSPFLRARQTAAPTIARFEPVAQEVWPVYEYTFLAPQRYMNTTGTQRQPQAMAYWQRNDPSFKDEGEGESFAELMGRVTETIDRLCHHQAAFIAMFGHGLFWRSILWSTLTGIVEPNPEAMRSYGHFMQSVWMDNTAILKARFRASGEIYFSGFDNAHLREVSA